MNTMHPSVNGYIRKNSKWKDELEQLRLIALDSPLKEEMKWRIPCYTFQDANVITVTALKECCVMSFFKGALLKDGRGILSKPGENTQSARVIRFTNVQEIAEVASLLKAYIEEAIEVEKAGLKVEFKSVEEFHVPEELKDKFHEMPDFKEAFEALTPGRQRGYLLHFSAPKQSKTRESRIDKWMPQIFDGKGMHDE